MPSCQEITDADEHKIWKIVPGFLRKKSRNVKSNYLEYQEVTKDNTNKAAFEEAELSISENDQEGVIKADTIGDREGQDHLGDNPRHRVLEASAKKSLTNRLSWTYGYKTSERSYTVLRKKDKDIVSPEPSLEFPVLQLEDEDQPSSIRPLQRGESFPGKLGAGTLSKHEAKRRLMSWRRTTVVRKNSEHQ